MFVYISIISRGSTTFYLPSCHRWMKFFLWEFIGFVADIINDVLRTDHKQFFLFMIWITYPKCLSVWTCKKYHSNYFCIEIDKNKFCSLRVIPCQVYARFDMTDSDLWIFFCISEELYLTSSKMIKKIGGTLHRIF